MAKAPGSDEARQLGRAPSTRAHAGWAPLLSRPARTCPQFRGATGTGRNQKQSSAVFPSKEKVTTVATWFWVLLVVLAILALFGGVGYRR
jgi:hypothetical protein